jgi:hypothetical protein
LYKYYRADTIADEKYHAKARELQKKQFEKFTKKLEKIYNKANENPEKYMKKIKKGYKYVNKLTNERIYQYI